MASVVAGGLFNAVAFAGAGYVFHKLDKKGYEAEMVRHNLAVETLQKKKEEWYEKTVEKKNKVALLRQQLEDANKDLDATNEALHAQVTNGNRRRYWTGTHDNRLLRTVRRDEDVYERCRRHHRICSGSVGNKNVVLNYFITSKKRL